MNVTQPPPKERLPDTPNMVREVHEAGGVEGQVHGMEEELKTKEEQGTKAKQAGQVAGAAQPGLKFTPAMLENNMAEQMTTTAD